MNLDDIAIDQLLETAERLRIIADSGRLSSKEAEHQAVMTAMNIERLVREIASERTRLHYQMLNETVN